jgi:uncharacterized repeat protein (TIGR03803 family)
MQPRKSAAFLATALVLFGLVLGLAPKTWAVPRYKVLHAFGKGKDGAGLLGSLLLDKRGDVYGTTTAGGTGGTVFELTNANGKWTESVLHEFNGNDGDGPSTGLIFDAGGNLYGSTCCGGGPYTYGTIFELTRHVHGWREIVIHRFGLHDGAGHPYDRLLMDGSGDLYGTGGDAAFELSPTSKGWREVVLHKFTGEHGDGLGPAAGMIFDGVGNLYGTTDAGGSSTVCTDGCGTVFELQRMSEGKWRETVLYSFGSFTGDGQVPGLGALLSGGAGTLYGTTSAGGTHLCSTGCGTVFKLTRQSEGRWKETTIYDFRDGASGNTPEAGVVMDKKGNLYGTAVYGGSAQCGCGVVYELSPSSNGKWKYTVLHTFTGFDGALPGASLIRDSKGNLYGTTITGGAGGAGVAFELTP